MPPCSTSDRVLFTTKPVSVLGALSRRNGKLPWGLVGRYGLPNDNDLKWLSSLAACHGLTFLGDAAPCDLLVFAWLRSHMDISFLGLNDRLLDACGVSPDARMVVTLAKSESDAMSLMRDIVPDLVTLLGPTCCDILNAGGKLELEALISFSNLEPGDLAEVIAPKGVS